MTKYIIRKPEFLKGAEQARFFPGTFMTLVIALLIFAAYFLLSLIAGAIYGATNIGLILGETTQPQAFLEGVFIFALYFEAALIAAALIYTRFIEKRAPATLGLAKRGFLQKYAAGFGLGLVMLAVYSLPLFINAPVYFTGLTPLIAVSFGAFVIQSAAEEVLFRGYILSSLLRSRGAVWAVGVSSTIFALIHIPGADISITNLLIILLLGAMLALYVLRTNSLWGAMGLHAAWNFFTGLIAPIALGPVGMDYAVIDSPAVYEDDTVYFVIACVMFSAVIVLLLFAGRNRLVVRRTQEQARLAKASDMTRRALTSDKALLRYAMRVSELAQSDGKIAALLYHAANALPSGYVRREFGDDMQNAIEAMTVRYTESPKEYWKRVIKHPAALAAKNAEIRLEEIKRPKYSGGPGVWFAGGRAQCPMLRWGIEADHCRHIAQVVDGAPHAEGEEYLAALSHDACRRCPGRQFIHSPRKD